MSILKRIPSSYFLFSALLLGVISGYFAFSWILDTANILSQLFLNLLKLVSLPIIFLSIVSTAAGMESMREIHRLGKKVAKYTLLTTIIAASIALLLFIVLQPVSPKTVAAMKGMPTEMPKGTYTEYLLQIVPSNVLHPFVENNVIGVLFLALLLSFAILTLPKEKKEHLQFFFSSLYAAITTMTKWIVAVMPIGIWAFVTLFVHDLQGGLEMKSLALYLLCIVSANLVQAIVVLPILLKIKGLPPIRTFRAMMPALSIAFFSKSSAGALPMAMKCGEENARISPKVSRFAFPLCTTINMNGCAAFILTTVLFVAMSEGIAFSYGEMILWVFVATIAAVGNAGVPMGCYFLSGALLATMNIPLHLLGVILPFYTLVDMLESAINVWSDSCVAAVVDKEIALEEAIVSEPEAGPSLISS